MECWIKNRNIIKNLEVLSRDFDREDLIYSRRIQPTEEMKRKIWERDKVCQVCEEKGEVIHHLKGKQASEDNLILLCRNCHTLVHTLLWLRIIRGEKVEWEFHVEGVSDYLTYYTCKRCGFRVISESDAFWHWKECLRHPEWKEEYEQERKKESCGFGKKRITLI